MKKKVTLVLAGLMLSMGMTAAYADSDNNGPENVEKTQSFQAYLQATGQNTDDNASSNS